MMNPFWNDAWRVSQVACSPSAVVSPGLADDASPEWG